MSCSICEIEASVQTLTPCGGCGKFAHSGCASGVGCRTTGCPYQEARTRPAPRVNTRQPRLLSREGEVTPTLIAVGVLIFVVLCTLFFSLEGDGWAAVFIGSVFLTQAVGEFKEFVSRTRSRES